MARICGTAVVLGALVGCNQILGITEIAPHAPDAFVADVFVADAPALDAPLMPVQLVQQATASMNNGATLDVNLSTLPRSQDVLILICGSEQRVVMVSGGGVSWQLAASSSVSPTIEVWFGVTNGTTGTATITGGAASAIWASLSEWSGLSVANTLDTGAGSGSVGGASTPDFSVTTTQAPELLVFAVDSYGAIADPSASWVSLPAVTAGAITQKAWYVTAYVTGVQKAQVTVTNDWDGALAAFRVPQ